MGLLDALNGVLLHSTVSHLDAGPSSAAAPGKPAKAGAKSRTHSTRRQAVSPAPERGDAMCNGPDADAIRTGTPHNTVPLDSWTLAELQTEARRYGFRASTDRRNLISQIEAVYDALEERRQLRADGKVPSSSQSMSSVIMLDEGDSTVGAITIASDDFEADQTEVGDLTAGLIGEGLISVSESRQDQGNAMPGHRHTDREHGRSSKADQEHENEAAFSSNASDESDMRSPVSMRKPTAPEPNMGRVPTHVAKQLHDAIRADADLYRRILMFEPVSFDEVTSTAKRAGVTGLRSKETLRNWLDVQCICFYTAELTGQRQRY